MHWSQCKHTCMKVVGLIFNEAENTVSEVSWIKLQSIKGLLFWKNTQAISCEYMFLPRLNAIAVLWPQHLVKWLSLQCSAHLLERKFNWTQWDMLLSKRVQDHTVSIHLPLIEFHEGLVLSAYCKRMVWQVVLFVFLLNVFKLMLVKK